MSKAKMTSIIDSDTFPNTAYPMNLDSAFNSLKGEVKYVCKTCLTMDRK